MFFDVQKLGNDYGITWDTAKTNNYSDFRHDFAAEDAAGAGAGAAAGWMISTKQFLRKVSESRQIPEDTLDPNPPGSVQNPTAPEPIAQGRVWSGGEALNLKLIDQIGGLQDAINYTADKLKLGDHYKVKEYPEQLSFAQSLALLLTNEEAPITHAKIDPLTREFMKMKSDLKELQELNDPAGAYARLPIGWDIR